MTNEEVIKKLSQYDPKAPVGLVNLSDDSGESDETLTEGCIDFVDGKIIITHTPDKTLS